MSKSSRHLVDREPLPMLQLFPPLALDDATLDAGEDIDYARRLLRDALAALRRSLGGAA